MIRVSVTYGDLVVEADFEADMYSPDIVEKILEKDAGLTPDDAAAILGI